MWTCTTNVEPLTGIGPGPLSDEEFDERVAAYEARFDAAQAGAVKRSGLYQHTNDKPPKAAAEVNDGD